MPEPRTVPAAELAAMRKHLIKRHHFDVDDECLIGNAEDLHWMHEDVHDDEDEFQTHGRDETD